MDDIKISLCIPTIKRYDNFLQYSLLKYIENKHITEIIVCDETGEDYEKIREYFNHPKLKLFKNDTKLGCFKNKMNVSSKANCEYICIFDSDNFADENYFIAFKEFLLNGNYSSNSLFLPSFAKPNFDYRWFTNKNITKDNIKSMISKTNDNKGCGLDVLLNTMNCIIPKIFFDTYTILNDHPWCDACFAYDSEYFCLYSLFIMNATIYCVSGMEYEHRVHEGSHYIETAGISENFHNCLHQRFNI
jgi:hypothetical protein